MENSPYTFSSQTITACSTTGYRIDRVQKVGEVYMSPGSVTEILHFYVAEYSEDMTMGAVVALRRNRKTLK
ncbi:hypothetical protein ACWGXJ_24815 [Paenibacillus sp. S33]